MVFIRGNNDKRDLVIKVIKEDSEINEDIKSEQKFCKTELTNSLTEADKYHFQKILGYDQHMQELMKKESKLEAFFAHDQKHLNQYYALRHEVYREENGWRGYNGLEGQFDREGQIVAVTRDDEVIGGMRLMFSDECKYLSNEHPGTQYDYKKFISKYDKRENLIIGEISSVVVMDHNRDSSVSSAAFDFTFKEAKAHGCHYVFGVATLPVSRTYRKAFHKLGYDLEIMINFPWERRVTYNFAPMFLIYVKLA